MFMRLNKVVFVVFWWKRTKNSWTGLTSCPDLDPLLMQFCFVMQACLPCCHGNMWKTTAGQLHRLLLLLFGLFIAQDPQTQPSTVLLAHVRTHREPTTYAGERARVSMLALAASWSVSWGGQVDVCTFVFTPFCWDIKPCWTDSRGGQTSL